jgi:hypothetical protein
VILGGIKILDRAFKIGNIDAFFLNIDLFGK